MAGHGGDSPWPLTTLPRCPVPQAARPSFAEKLVVLGARHRNESAARESTLGFRSAPDRPEREGGAVRRLVGIEVGVVSGVFNLESPGVDAPGWRLRHEEAYHAA